MIKIKHLDLIFTTSFIFSLAALSMTHYALAHGAVEIAPVTKIAVYNIALGINWVFAGTWTLLSFVYYIFRGGALIKSKGDRYLTTLYPFVLLNFSFIDMWNDILILCYML